MGTSKAQRKYGVKVKENGTARKKPKKKDKATNGNYRILKDRANFIPNLILKSEKAAFEWIEEQTEKDKQRMTVCDYQIHGG